jgi:hypothetical protein
MEIGTKLQWRGKRGGLVGEWFRRLLLYYLRKNMAGICQRFGLKITGCYGNCVIYIDNEFP